MPLAEWVGCSVPENRTVAVHFGAVCSMLARLEGLYVMVLQQYDGWTFQLSQHKADSANRHKRTPGNRLYQVCYNSALLQYNNNMLVTAVQSCTVHITFSPGLPPVIVICHDRLSHVLLYESVAPDDYVVTCSDAGNILCHAPCHQTVAPK